MSDIKIGLIGGSGLGAVLAREVQGECHEIETPFGRPSDAIVETEWAGVPVYFLNRHGPGHLLNPSAVPYRANIFAMKRLGCTHILASGAVGSLREEYRPRDLVIASQIIDQTRRRSGTFFENSAVHVEFSEPFCPVLRRMLMEAGQSLPGGDKITVHEGGCYVCMEGPAFSTRSESLMHRLWGGDLIGMTAMPEAKLAREAEISYALTALVTDYDSWKPHEGDGSVSLLNEIIGNLEAATANAAALLRRMVEIVAGRTEELRSARAQSALKQAIWSDKNQIAAEERERLAPLWRRYF